MLLSSQNISDILEVGQRIEFLLRSYLRGSSLTSHTVDGRHDGPGEAPRCRINGSAA